AHRSLSTRPWRERSGTFSSTTPHDGLVAPTTGRRGVPWTDVGDAPLCDSARIARPAKSAELAFRSHAPRWRGGDRAQLRRVASVPGRCGGPSALASVGPAWRGYARCRCRFSRRSRTRPASLAVAVAFSRRVLGTHLPGARAIIRFVQQIR